MNKNSARLPLNFILLALIILCFSSAVRADDYIEEQYQLYCKACHTAHQSDAPIAFVVDEWQPRLRQGFTNVVESAIRGKGNMPPQGSCMECTYEDIEDLVRYMASEQ